jgi:hypothetical protein
MDVPGLGEKTFISQDVAIDVCRRLAGAWDSNGLGGVAEISFFHKGKSVREVTTIGYAIRVSKSAWLNPPRKNILYVSEETVREEVCNVPG